MFFLSLPLPPHTYTRLAKQYLPLWETSNTGQVQHCRAQLKCKKPPPTPNCLESNLCPDLMAWLLRQVTKSTLLFLAFFAPRYSWASPEGTQMVSSGSLVACSEDEHNWSDSKYEATVDSLAKGLNCSCSITNYERRGGARWCFVSHRRMSRWNGKGVMFSSHPIAMCLSCTPGLKQPPNLDLGAPGVRNCAAPVLPSGLNTTQQIHTLGFQICVFYSPKRIYPWCTKTWSASE